MKNLTLSLQKWLFIIAALLFFTACASQVPNTTDNVQYAVGSETIFVHDNTRPFDQVAGVDVGIRSLITEIWYPVDQADLNNDDVRPATYGDYSFGDKAVHRKMLTNTTFFHLTPETVVEGVSQDDIDAAIEELFTRPRGSYLNAPLATSNGKMPVVVMTHGDAGSRYNMETACEYLAANGYFVIAPEHTGNTPFAFTGKDPKIDKELAEIKPLLNEDGTYGPSDKYGQTYTPLIKDRDNPQAMVNLDNSLLERVNDLRAVLRELEKMNRSGKFAGRLDLENIGLMGRSFGGTTTLAALGLEPRFTAGVSVVPLVMPDVRNALPKNILKDKGQESVLLAADGDAVLNTLSQPTMLLSGAEDALIIGAGSAMASAMGGEPATPENPLPALRKSYLESEQAAIWGLLSDSNHSSFGVSAGFWWPDLKTKTQQRFFAPDETFELIDVELAHQIQQEKILQFFDYFIVGKESAEQRIKANEFERAGLVYETRNF